MLCARAPGQFQSEHAWFLGMFTGKIASTVSTALSLRKLRLDATTDPTTRLPNSRTTFERLQAEIARASRQGTPLAVFFLDLNDLKPVNDSYGHAAGDKVLAATAERLRASLRPYDVLGRVGGDEFVVIMPGIPPGSAGTKAESLKKAVAEHRIAIADGLEVRTTISVGVALYPEDGRDAEELICVSDQRMYLDKKRSKPHGRGALEAARSFIETPGGGPEGAFAPVQVRG